MVTFSGNRVYIQHSYGVNTLVSWSQPRCEKCHRFLGIKQQKYCNRCAYEVIKERNREYSKKLTRLHLRKSYPDKRDYRMRCLKEPYHKIFAYLYCKIYRNADKFNIGDSI